ncbi:Histidine biosynthesis trifunctional protein [Yarrowia sp. C11]|nr:Histidine biosynthesis trifunctional protein [Yarrowia sp. E02]KAG5369721.1 Histidine biosynthesis trifunctional protein [Yarrowia sp. C11]
MFPLLPQVSSVSVPAVATAPGKVLVSILQSDVSETAQALKKAFGQAQFHIIANTDLSTDEYIHLLDAGATSVFVSGESAVDLAASGVPAGRLTVVGSKPDQIDVGGVFLRETPALEDVATLASSFAKKLLPDGGAPVVYVNVDDPKAAADLVAAGATVVVSSAKLTTEHQADKLDDKFPIADLLLASLSTDRQDGLYTTLVSDVLNQSLGLVYSSAESIKEAIRTGTGVYQSRRHGLWYKGKESGNTQKLVRIETDCDGDCLKFIVEQTGAGFCHFNTESCFSAAQGIACLEKTLQQRLQNAPEGSYTKRLFDDADLLRAKIMEEAEELVEAKDAEEVSWEAADLLYFAMVKVVKEGVSWAQVMNNLDSKHMKISRRKGDAKQKWVDALGIKRQKVEKVEEKKTEQVEEKEEGKIQLNHINADTASEAEIEAVLARPAQKTSDIMKLVLPIVEGVKTGGDKKLLELTEKFDGVKLTTPILTAPFSADLMKISDEVKASIDMSIENVKKFHAAQLDTTELVVETQPGVVCKRFSRPIESVGLYIPGGTAVLPSTSLHLGVPAMVAGCKNIVLASPPRKDGTLSPEVVYVADQIGAKAVVLAGGAQAVAAMAYGTETVPKVDKIMGPGNQFVTAAKMYVSNDTTAKVAIDMPAGPSEVLVICDKHANPAFVASDLLSQAEHGVDSQVILLAVDCDQEHLDAIDAEVNSQALALPRVDIIRKCIAHSSALSVKTMEEAFKLSNQYAPEHLILQIEDAEKYVPLVDHAGSIFVGAYSPESCGDYSSGTNHTLPTYGYARMYSGVNTGTFTKHITSQQLTREGLEIIGPAVMTLAATEGLDAHRMAVKVRLDAMKKQ